MAAAALGLSRAGGAAPSSVAAAAPTAAHHAVRCPIPRPLRGAFERASTATVVPLALLTAVAETESRFDPQARSGAGALGVMQVLPETARMFGLDPRDPADNVLAGARYLRHLLGTLGSADLAIAAYNAGPTAVAASGVAPAETLSYVADVDNAWRRLQGCV